ncbi:MAG TPA: hypothetical protein VLT62_04405 [Candidatus Methylomirabilis sp.]|nr:hypothetical protein [Candidatus Methylomirabilis sp.]
MPEQQRQSVILALQAVHRRFQSVVMSERYARLSQSDLKAAVERKPMLQVGTDGEVHP